MNRYLLIFVLFSLKIFSQSAPPLADKDIVTDTYYGVKVIDEYRNLENLENPIVQNWLKLQTNYSDTVLNSISSRDNFLKRLYDIDKKSEYFYRDIQITNNYKYFYLKMKSDDNYRKLYWRNGFEGEEHLIYDPKNFKPENNKSYVISYYKPSNDGTKIAIAITEGGREISEIVIFDLIKGVLLPEIITNTWPSDLGGVEWLNDDSGFIYVYIPNIDIQSDDFIKNAKSVVYKIGSSSIDFKDVFSKSNNPEISISKEDFPIINIPSCNQNYYIGNLGGATTYTDHFVAKTNDIYTQKLIWKPLFKKEDKIKTYVLNDEKLFFISEKDSKSRICSTSISLPNFDSPDVIVDNISDELINDIAFTKEGLFFTTKKNGVVAKLYFYSNGSFKPINLPFSAGDIVMKTLDADKSDIWIICSGWTQQRKRFKYNVTTNVFSPENFSGIAQFPEYENVVVEEIEIKSHDGIDLPLTIIYNKGLKKNGKNRVIIDGYGSYGISNSPYFSPYMLLWVIDGGVLVMSHVRGGGEKGDQWHKDGFKESKPNSWKDLISSAEYLIKEKYTSSKYIGLMGSSAGGILIGRAITERPDLFKAAVIEVGMLNAIRNEITPNGPNNIKEFGTIKNENEFKYLFEMDAYHHIKKDTKYPATLITAGMNDPRVTAWIPAKFAAKLQANNVGKNPILLDVEMDGGHGGDVTANKVYESIADTLAFLYWQLGHKKFKLKRMKL